MFYNPYNYNPYTYNDLEIRQPVNRFFEHINGEGMSFTLNSGENLAYVGDPWNDRISSVHVAPRTLVILYEHVNFGGQKKILENKSNASYLFNINSDFNDTLSSIKTYRIC